MRETMNFIASHEGLALTAYMDTDHYAICYGNRAKKGQTATEAQCLAMLENRVREVMQHVQKLYNGLNDNQLIALTSLYYNVRNPFHVHWRYHNGYSDRSIANAIRMYTQAGGIQLSGLVKRRNFEANLYQTP